MEKNLEKSLKRFLKRKVKITTAFIVAFLLGSLTAYGDIQVKYENSEIKFYRDNNDITEEMKKIGTVTGNLTDGFVWTINGEIAEQIKIDSSIKNISFNIINNGKIINSSSSSGYYSGNGIFNNSTINSIKNYGTILGNSSGWNYSGNGIYNPQNTINNIENYGTISGNSSGGQYLGNGILNYHNTGVDRIKKIVNNGTISGSSSNGGQISGNGILNYYNAVIWDIENYGTISGNFADGNSSGNGIYNYYNSTIENIKNYGRISSENNMGNAILNENSTIKNIINNGRILSLGNEEQSNNGIYNNSTINNSTIKNIVNNGRISGKSSGGNLSGNGIINADNNKGSATIKNIINGNIISGSGSGTLSGNGILNYNSVIENIANSGIVSGTSSASGNKSGNGIVNFNATINNLKNYGIITGSNKAVDSDSEIKSQENFGLLIDRAGKDTQTITAEAEGEQEIPVEFNDDGSVKTTEKRFIINGAEGANALALNSSDLKNKISEDKKGNYFNETENNYQDLIINVVGDNNNSLNINSDFNISQSTINGYKDAVVFSAEEKTFTGNSININAGGNAFTGSNFSDSINLSGSSTVNGNINLGDGEDKISFDTSVLNGDITGDNDTIIFDKSQINGNITSSNGKIIISGGENTLFNTGSSVINGNIALTDGEISIAEGTQINGKIELGGNTAAIWLSENQKVNEKINITATEKTLGLNYNVSADNLESMKNQMNENGFTNLQLADRGNSYVDLRGINLSKVVGGNGDDNFIISTDELKNISIDGGIDSSKENDGDTLELTTAVDNTATGNPNLFDNINNIENLKLANAEGNKLDINNLATDGNIKFKNYVGGDKDDSFTVSVENFGKVSLIDGGDGTDKLTINGEKNNTEISLNKTTGIENFEITASKDSIGNTINIDDWEYLNSNKDVISITLKENSIKGSKESIGNLQNITGDGNTSVILTNNISDKNVSDINGNTGNKDENYDFVKNLSNISDIYLQRDITMLMLIKS